MRLLTPDHLPNLCFAGEAILNHSVCIFSLEENDLRSWNPIIGNSIFISYLEVKKGKSKVRKRRTANASLCLLKEKSQKSSTSSTLFHKPFFSVLELGTFFHFWVQIIDLSKEAIVAAPPPTRSAMKVKKGYYLNAAIETPSGD